MNPVDNKHVSVTPCTGFCLLTTALVAKPRSLTLTATPGGSALCTGPCREEPVPVNSCSPSPANHKGAPRWPQHCPEGRVGNLALGNKWGSFQKHGDWDAHLGHGAGPVRTAQIMPALFVLMNIAPSLGGLISPAERHHLDKPPQNHSDAVPAFVKGNIQDSGCIAVLTQLAR